MQIPGGVSGGGWIRSRTEPRAARVADTIVFVKRAASLLILFVVFVCVAWVLGPLCIWVAQLIMSPLETVRSFSSDSPKQDGLIMPQFYPWFINYPSPIYLTACTIFALLQVIFVAPLVGPLRLAPSGRSLRASVIVAALVASFLFLALFASGMEAILLFSPSSSAPSSGFSGSDPSLLKFLWSGRSAGGWLAFGEIVVAWLICSSIMACLLWNAGHTQHPNALGRWTRRLFAGTVIELVLSIPILIILQRKNSCYCGLMTFWSLITGIAGLVWLCGPAAILLATRTSRRAWGHTVCGNCGYERHSSSARCSECGQEFKDHKSLSQPADGA